MKKDIGIGIAGIGAGTINGLLGAGGGMVLAPMLGALTDLEEREIFGLSVTILLPICVISLVFSDGWDSFSILHALPYLLGSTTGGFLTSLLSKKIPTLWLHRALGILILWGGIRYLC